MGYKQPSLMDCGYFYAPYIDPKWERDTPTDTPTEPVELPLIFNPETLRCDPDTNGDNKQD